MKNSVHPQLGRIMKLTVLLLTLALIKVSAKGVAQTVTYSAKRVPLATVFSQIKKQTGYVFFYVSQDIEGSEKVSVDFKKTSLTAALDALFSNQPLMYSIKGNTIFIRRKSVSPPLPPSVDTAHVTIILNGTVKSEKGDPLIGATIHMRGGNTTALTDANGNFVIAAPEGGGVLVFSYVGYQTSEMRVSKTGTLNIVLKLAET